MKDVFRIFQHRDARVNICLSKPSEMLSALRHAQKEHQQNT